MTNRNSEGQQPPKQIFNTVPFDTADQEHDLDRECGELLDWD